MPIEIRELHIKAIVNQESSSVASQSVVKQQSAEVADTDKLVAECVEKVLEILRQRNER